MNELAHIAATAATDPTTCLLIVVPLSFALIPLAERVWWIHGPVAIAILAYSLVMHTGRSLPLNSFLVGLFAFAPLCRDIPNTPLLYRISIFWFSGFALLSAAVHAASNEAQISPQTVISTSIAGHSQQQ